MPEVPVQGFLKLAARTSQGEGAQPQDHLDLDYWMNSALDILQLEKLLAVHKVVNHSILNA